MSPTVLLIPGSWHPKEAFAPLAEHLQALGLSAQATQLESVGGFNTLLEDAAALRGTVTALSDNGSDVILVAHSYAGAAAAPILRETAKDNRKQEGKTGGVIGIVYIAAFLPPEGPTVEEGLGGKLPPWQLVDVSLKLPRP